MKQTSEALSEAQDQVTVRRQLLESGRIRLVREPKPATTEQKEHQQDRAAPAKPDSK